MHVGLDSRNPGPQNDFDRWIPSFDKGPKRIAQRFYMYKDCKNKCKLETSRLRGWLIDPFMKSTSKCNSKGCTALSLLMSRTFGGVHGKTDTYQLEDFSAQEIKSKSHNYLSVFCQQEKPTNGFNRIIKSSPFLISLSNHSLKKFLDFKG